MTRQEINMILYEIQEILMEPKDRIRVSYQKMSDNNPVPPAETADEGSPFGHRQTAVSGILTTRTAMKIALKTN